MKHIILAILLTLGVWAQEVGVPYVNKEKIGNLLSIKNIYVDNANRLIFYRDKEDYIIKDLIHNKDILKVNPKRKFHECIANSNLSMIACKSRDSFDGDDDSESVELYEVGQANSYPVLESKYGIRQMMFSEDRKTLFIYEMGHMLKAEDRRPVSMVIVYDLSSKKIIKQAQVAGDGDMQIAGSKILVRDGIKYDDLVTNPLHTILDKETLKTERTFEQSVIFGLSEDGKAILKKDKANDLYRVDLDFNSTTKLCHIDAKLFSVKEYKPNRYLLSDADNNDKLYELFCERNGSSSKKLLVNLGLESSSFDKLVFNKDKTSFIFKNIVLNMDTLEEELKIYPLNTENWLIITPDGYFDGSPESRKYLYIKTSSGESVPIDDESYQKYHSSQVIKNILNQVFANKKPNGAKK